MAKYSTDDVLEIANAIKRAPNKVAFLIGAGCSLSAGIPLAKRLVEEIHEKYSHEIKRLLKLEQQHDYGCCMGVLTKDERKELLGPYLQNAKINWAHIALASLICKGFVRRVLTFNFDPVLARACGLLGQYPATYDFGVSPSDKPDYLAEPCVIHLHGQGYGPIMLNSEEETKEHAKRLRPLIDDTYAEFPLIVVGYSGEADKVFEQLRDLYAGRKRIYWLGFEDEPKDHLRPLLDGRHKNACRYIGGADADAILILLAQRLDCFPPQVFADPAGHLLEEITDVVDFPLEKTGYKTDLLKSLRERLNGNGGALRLDLIGEAALKGDSKAIVESQKATPAGEESSVPPEIAAWARLFAGNEHYDRAKAENSVEHYQRAAQDYEAALAIKPNMHEALYNWGNVLAELGRLKGDEALFRDACAKFEAALTIKPDDHEALANWGVALGDIAKLKGDEALFRDACAKFEAALAIKPDADTALYNSGGSLLSWWRLTKDAALLEKAREVLDRAEQLNSKMPYNCACLAAVLGDEEGCRTRLLRAKEFGALPPPDHLKSDPDLESMREKPWFKELVGE